MNHSPGNWTTSKQYLGLARSSLLFSERADGDQLSSSEPCKTGKKVVAKIPNMDCERSPPCLHPHCHYTLAWGLDCAPVPGVSTRNDLQLQQEAAVEAVADGVGA